MAAYRISDNQYQFIEYAEFYLVLLVIRAQFFCCIYWQKGGRSFVEKYQQMVVLKLPLFLQHIFVYQ